MKNPTYAFMTDREARARMTRADLDRALDLSREEFRDPSNLKEGFDADNDDAQ